MFSGSSLVKLIVFEKQKNSKNTEEPSTVAAMCSTIFYGCVSNTLFFNSQDVSVNYL